MMASMGDGLVEVCGGLTMSALAAWAMAACGDIGDMVASAVLVASGV